MSLPPPNYDIRASLLPDGGAIPIKIMSGGALADDKVKVLDILGIDGELQAELGESVLEGFLEDLHKPSCTAASGTGAILNPNECPNISKVFLAKLKRVVKLLNKEEPPVVTAETPGKNNNNSMNLSKVQTNLFEYERKPPVVAAEAPKENVGNVVPPTKPGNGEASPAAEAQSTNTSQLRANLNKAETELAAIIENNAIKSNNQRVKNATKKRNNALAKLRNRESTNKTRSAKGGNPIRRFAKTVKKSKLVKKSKKQTRSRN